jgi:hypothetical protein
LASPNVCAAADLFVGYPWYLSEVISGTPKLLQPFLESAKYAALQRNYHWQYLMERRAGNRAVILSNVTAPYPVKSDLISDRAADDAGGNFGRIARTGLLAEFTTEAGRRMLSGIPAHVWRRFLVMFKDRATDQAVERTLSQIRREIEDLGNVPQTEVDELIRILQPIARQLQR